MYLLYLQTCICHLCKYVCTRGRYQRLGGVQSWAAWSPNAASLIVSCPTIGAFVLHTVQMYPLYFGCTSNWKHCSLRLKTQLVQMQPLWLSLVPQSTPLYYSANVPSFVVLSTRRSRVLECRFYNSLVLEHDWCKCSLADCLLSHNRTPLYYIQCKCALFGCTLVVPSTRRSAFYKKFWI